MASYFESVHRRGVRYEILDYNKAKQIVRLRDTTGVVFEMPASIMRQQRYKLIKDSDHAIVSGVQT